MEDSYKNMCKSVAMTKYIVIAIISLIIYIFDNMNICYSSNEFKILEQNFNNCFLYIFIYSIIMLLSECVKMCIPFESQTKKVFTGGKIILLIYPFFNFILSYFLECRHVLKDNFIKTFVSIEIFIPMILFIIWKLILCKFPENFDNDDDDTDTNNTNKQNKYGLYIKKGYIIKDVDKKKEKTKLNTLECSICMVKYAKDDVISILKCSHFYHKNCINTWFGIKKSCPLCRNMNV